MSVGCEWIIDAHGCDPAALAALPTMRSVCERAIDELNLHTCGQPQWKQFPGPGGVTGMYLLTESHLTCHTFPEHGLATFNLYCCRPHPTWPWQRRLMELLGATQVRIRVIERGAQENPNSPPSQGGAGLSQQLDRSHNHAVRPTLPQPLPKREGSTETAVASPGITSPGIASPGITSPGIAFQVIEPQPAGEARL